MKFLLGAPIGALMRPRGKTLRGALQFGEQPWCLVSREIWKGHRKIATIIVFGSKP